MYSNKTGKRALAKHALVRLSICDAARPPKAHAKNLIQAGIFATERD